jgi:hypothetical protein
LRTIALGPPDFGHTEYFNGMDPLDDERVRSALRELGQLPA